MEIFLAAKKLDLNSGDKLICIINELDAQEYGIGLNTGDRVEIVWNGLEEPVVVVVDTTEKIVKEGEIGIYEDIWNKYSVDDNEVVKVILTHQSDALNSIKKKLLGEKLDYQDFTVIMTDIASGKLNDILTTFFISSGYSPGFDREEISLMTKAMAMTGDILKFPGIVADKHSIGGVGGKGVTPLVVPIVASCGVIVPNTSTRAVTSASATTDMLEVIMPMSFQRSQLEDFIEKNGAFMVWGGGLDLAPADDEIIKIQKNIGIESIDKFVASILAKKIAQGVNHVIFDVPTGKGAKIDQDEFKQVKTMFEELGAEFGIKVLIYGREVDGIDGFAIGPSLECREFLRVYEQHPERSIQLENASLDMAGKLLELVGKASNGQGIKLAKEMLLNGKAFEKLRQIIQAQGGDPTVKSDSMATGGVVYEYKAKKSGVIDMIDNKKVFEVAKALGNPRIKEAGLYFHVMPHQEVKAGDLLVTLYANSEIRLDLGKKVINKDEIFFWK